MHIHGECFIYKNTKISDRLREWYVVARYGHRSKTEGDRLILGLVPMAILMLPSKLSSLRTPCPSCRPSSQIGTLKSMTCLLLLPHFVDAMKSPYNGYHLTATCLEMRLLTFWQRRAQQKSKWIDPPATLR